MAHRCAFQIVPRSTHQFPQKPKRFRFLTAEAWIAELSQIPRKTVDDIIRGRGIWAEMPRNELCDRTREQLKVLIEQIAYSSATEVMERLQAKIDKASYMETVSTMSALADIVRFMR